MRLVRGEAGEAQEGLQGGRKVSEHGGSGRGRGSAQSLKRVPQATQSQRPRMLEAGAGESGQFTCSCSE